MQFCLSFGFGIKIEHNVLKMKKKKVIGIDLNEVVRAHWYNFEEFYKKYMKEHDEEAVITKPFDSYDYLKHFSFPEKKETVKYLKKDIPDIPAVDYIVDKDGVSKADPLLFDSVEEILTPQKRLEKFLFEDYLWELFGNCGKIYDGVIRDIHKLYDKHRNDFDFVIVSIEQHRSIMPTLFFISKVGFQLPHYFFGGKPETIWNKVDILITANPALLKTKPRGKHVIQVVREFNKDVPIRPGTMYIRNISDFHEEDKYGHRDLKKFLKPNNLIYKIKNYVINLLNKTKSYEQ